MAQSKEMLIQVDQQYAINTLKDEDAVKTLLEQVKILATEEVFDVSTKAGQKACASMAAKVAKCKTTIDNFGKDYVGEIKATVKDIDANRKLLRDSLDYLKQEVRAPLNEIEQAEKDRIAAHELILLTVKDAANDMFTGSADVQACIDRISAIDTDALEEFAPEGEKAKNQTLFDLTTKLEQWKQQEFQAAELARLEEENRKKDAELQAQKAAEQARIDAERESARKVAEAEEAARQAEIKAQKAEEEAQAKVEAEKKAAAEAQAKREADVAHRQGINRQVLEDLLSIPTINEDQAKEIIRAIVKGEIRNTTINY